MIVKTRKIIGVTQYLIFIFYFFANVKNGENIYIITI